MTAYVPLPRRCLDCGAVDQIVVIETACGDRLCARCWIETTRDSSAHRPATPRLDEHMRRIEEREASQL
jgi:hypothetical protein